jgi:di/tricarboxylate transporter
MLPVATAPNAIDFAAERVTQATMMRYGPGLKLLCIGVFVAMTVSR